MINLLSSVLGCARNITCTWSMFWNSYRSIFWIKAICSSWYLQNGFDSLSGNVLIYHISYSPELHLIVLVVTLHSMISITLFFDSESPIFSKPSVRCIIWWHKIAAKWSSKQSTSYIFWKWILKKIDIFPLYLWVIWPDPVLIA